MKIQCLEEKTLQKIFTDFLHSSKKTLGTRVFTMKNRPAPEPFSNSEYNVAEKDYQNAIALIYLKTFLGKSPEDFEKSNFKAEAQRLGRIISLSPRKEELITKLTEMLRSGNVDIKQCLSNPLFAGVFNENIKQSGLTSEGDDKGTDLLPPENRDHITARIYFNPSKQYFSQFMLELQSRCAAQEIDLVMKKRGEFLGAAASDNLVVYANNNDFGKIVKIITEIGKDFPEIAESFGSTPSGLGVFENNDWFAFSREPQRSNKNTIGLSTSNYEVDYLINSFLLPSLIIRDFNKLFDTSTPEGRRLIADLMSSGDNNLRNLVDGLLNPTQQQQLFERFTDLSFVRTESRKETAKSAALSEEERKGFSPELIRIDNGGARTDMVLLRELEQIKLPNGDTKTRKVISAMLQNPVIKQAMQRYYEEHTEEPAKFMRDLLIDYMEASEYIDDECFALSLGMKQSLMKAGLLTNVEKKLQPSLQDSLGNMEKAQLGENAISALLGGTLNLRMKLYSIAEQLGIDTKSFNEITSRDKIERLYIRLVGVDAIALGSESIKSKEALGQKKIIHIYENSLQAERQYRGKKLYQQLMGIEDKEERTEFLESLSLHELEDTEAYYGLQKNVNRMAETTAYTM